MENSIISSLLQVFCFLSMLEVFPLKAFQSHARSEDVQWMVFDAYNQPGGSE